MICTLFTIAFLVYRNDHTCLLVSWCFFKFPRNQLTQLVNQSTLPFNAFNISGRISSSPTAFPDFNPRTSAATSVNVKTSSFPQSIVLHVSVSVALTWFNNSSKYSLQCKKISFHPGECSQLNPWWRWYLTFPTQSTNGLPKYFVYR